MTTQGSFTPAQLGWIALTLWVIVALFCLFANAIEADRKNRQFIASLKSTRPQTPDTVSGDSPKEHEDES